MPDLPRRVASPEGMWVCVCGYQNVGPICTHCAVTYESAVAYAEHAKGRSPSTSTRSEMSGCDQVRSEHQTQAMAVDCEDGTARINLWCRACQGFLFDEPFLWASLDTFVERTAQHQALRAEDHDA